MTTTNIELYAIDNDLTIEELPEGSALATKSTASSMACAACPGSTASTVSTMMCLG